MNRNVRVLVLGASGFVGSAVLAALLRAGMDARCVVRDQARFSRRFPDADARTLDLTAPAAREAGRWAEPLAGMDAVVNVAGVLQPRRTREAWAVHRDAPEALYLACEQAEVRRVIHVSAIGVVEADTAYAQSKRAGEEALTARDLDWTVLRPAVVVGDDSFGGTSLLRAIAVFPVVTPILGDGKTPMDLIHRDDLAAGIVALLRTGRGVRTVLEPAGPGRMAFAEVVAAYRNWFGLASRPFVVVPNGLARLVARIGDVTGMPPATSTALAQFHARLTGDAAAFETATGVRPRGLVEILAARPAGSQDLWHARLFLARPLVRMGLALFWAVSGLVGLLSDPAAYESVLEHLARGWGREIAVAASLTDLAIAAALIAGWRLKLMAWVQMVTIAGYTAVLGVLAPGMWADPYGSLVKNLPILILVLVHRILEEER